MTKAAANNPPTTTVAITLTNGSLAVMQFLTVGRGNKLPSGAVWQDRDKGIWEREPSEENISEEIRKTFEGHEEQPKTWRVIQQDQLPTDRTFRGAWVDTNGVIAHDITKAREIHRERIRNTRVSKLQELDIEYQKADEISDLEKKKEIASKKQLLRDLPAHPSIEEAQTISALKAFWPEELL